MTISGLWSWLGWRQVVTQSASDTNRFPEPPQPPYTTRSHAPLAALKVNLNMDNLVRKISAMPRTPVRIHIPTKGSSLCGNNGITSKKSCLFKQSALHPSKTRGESNSPVLHKFCGSSWNSLFLVSFSLLFFLYIFFGVSYNWKRKQLSENKADNPRIHRNGKIWDY